MRSKYRAAPTFSFLVALLLTGISLTACASQPANRVDALVFRPDAFTLETRTVKTTHGDHRVELRAYKHIPYVAKPVDTDYQSLDIYVPVAIDGLTVDATKAPMLFNVNVGGYMSSRNTPGGNALPGPPPGAMPGGPPAGMRRPSGNSDAGSRGNLALAAGFVVISPGARGRDNRFDDGTFYGKAPAVIVDLKAAVRYVRFNDALIPGDAEKIVSVGCSAGGALSALLGASGNHPLFEPFLDELGAADAGDHIFASACYSPITDLDHSDMSYEWMYGNIPTSSGLVDQDLSRQFAAQYADYLNSLALEGRDNFGRLTAENIGDYLLRFFTLPAATSALQSMGDAERSAYLAEHKFIVWDGTNARFTFDDYVRDVGRMKGMPAFDDFAMRSPETNLFGNATRAARHYTDFALQVDSGDANARIDPELRRVVNMMNAMYFAGNPDAESAAHWWLRNGTHDNDNAQVVMIGLATRLENSGAAVDAAVFWDGGHCADDDPEGMIAWIKKITAD